MYSATLTSGQIALAAASIVLGLALDTQLDIVGQTVMSACHWALVLVLLAGMPSGQRRSLVACLAIATAGELILSLVWGLYDYRLGNVPLFVPPGHVLLLLLGIALAHRLTHLAAQGIFGCAVLYAAGAGIAGFDTFGLGLLALLAAAWFAAPAQRRLYAATLVLALALELCGTALGNWQWAPLVPGTGLVTTNPPALAGAFYCALDGLVAAAAVAAAPRLAARTG